MPTSRKSNQLVTHRVRLLRVIKQYNSNLFFLTLVAGTYIIYEMCVYPVYGYPGIYIFFYDLIMNVHFFHFFFQMSTQFVVSSCCSYYPKLIPQYCGIGCFPTTYITSTFTSSLFHMDLPFAFLKKTTKLHSPPFLTLISQF